MTIAEIVLYRLRMPLATPYHVSYRVYDDFDPIIVEARDGNGGVGWGEGHISPGYSHETIDGGWAFCRAHAERMVGLDPAVAKAAVTAAIANSAVAATALITAVEMLEGSPLLVTGAEARLPLLTPFHASAPDAIAADFTNLPGCGCAP